MTAYTIFGQGATSGIAGGGGGGAASYGCERYATVAGTYTGLWFFSPPGDAGVPLPDQIGLFNLAGTLLQSNAPTWSGIAGSGWIRAPFTSPALVGAGVHVKGVIHDTPGGGNWLLLAAVYWAVGGPGASGLSSGPLNAPSDAASSSGQEAFATGATLAYPGTPGGGFEIWIDPEFTPSGGGTSPAGLLRASII
jgi:hypothetical protein